LTISESGTTVNLVDHLPDERAECQATQIDRYRAYCGPLADYAA